MKDLVGEEWISQAVACLVEIVPKGEPPQFTSVTILLFLVSSSFLHTVCPGSKHLLEVSVDDDGETVLQ